MIVLGLEGTAHTFGSGLVDESRILSSITATYKPKKGGIHPKEAAVFLAENAHSVISRSMNESSLSIKDVDLIAFSMGPGLGPSLRVVATAARSLSIKYSVPIIGVNHPMGHIEIGRFVSGAYDPVMLYVSGGNTQVIAHMDGRYRVFGETIDIGLGNMLDKFARDIGIPFPGGPVIEKLALSGEKLIDLPYSVKGMNTSFSGIYTAAKNALSKGARKEDVCFSIQETAFAMLVEVTERALDYLGKKEILLAGGVAMNNRLRSMFKMMGEETGSTAYLTEPKYCMDNGAMIARAGYLLYKSGIRNELSDTGIRQRYRIDEVAAPWINSSWNKITMMGAESVISLGKYLTRDAVIKKRQKKGYREPNLDQYLRTARMKNESAIEIRLSHSVRTPIIYSVNFTDMEITMERINGESLRDMLAREVNNDRIIESLAKTVAKMHAAGISHGDLTTGNIMLTDRDEICIIDASMGKLNAEMEDLSQDLFLLRESFHGMHASLTGLWDSFVKNYVLFFPPGKEIVDYLNKIDARRRYV